MPRGLPVPLSVTDPEARNGLGLGGAKGQRGHLVPLRPSIGVRWPLSEVAMELKDLLFVLGGVAVGLGASFSGLGGGFLIVPLLLVLGYTAQKAVGTSFMAILVISVSALLAHNKLANIDYKVGILLGLGGIIGAQIGPRLLENMSAGHFKRVFACILVGLAAYLFFQK